jgi:cellobiose-specific phosphotransferase system component IIA
MSAWFSTTALGLCGICCVISIKLGLAARDAFSKYEMALQSQKAAEREVEQSKGLVEKSEESQASAHEMVATAMAHESLWSGVSAAAELVAHSFSELRQIDPTGLRRKKFNEKMKASSAELLNFVQAGEG